MYILSIYTHTHIHIHTVLSRALVVVCHPFCHLLLSNFLFCCVPGRLGETLAEWNMVVSCMLCHMAAPARNMFLPHLAYFCLETTETWLFSATIWPWFWYHSKWLLCFTISFVFTAFGICPLPLLFMVIVLLTVDLVTKYLWRNTDVGFVH